MVALLIAPYAVLVGSFWYMSNGFEKRLGEPTYVLTKTSPALFLGLANLLYGRLNTKDRVLSGFALLFGATGDYLMGSSREGVLPGAIVFGIGHLLYLATFAHKMKRVWKPLLLSALAWGIYVNYVCFLPKLQTHFRSIIILTIYSLIDLTCLVTSGSIWFFGGKNEISMPSQVRFAGYLLFFVSDSTLILAHEAYQIPYSEYIILLLYYAAQYMILLGTALARNTKVR